MMLISNVPSHLFLWTLRKNDIFTKDKELYKFALSLIYTSLYMIQKSNYKLLVKMPNCIQRYLYKKHFIHLSYPVNHKRVFTKFKFVVNLFKNSIN